MRRLYSFLICLLAVVAMQAQIITTTPTFPTENDEVAIIFDATKGTAGLKGFTGDDNKSKHRFRRLEARPNLGR